MEIKLQQVTRQDLQEGIVIENDDYNLFGEGFLKSRKDVFLKNPNLTDPTSVLAILARADNVVVGSFFPFPTIIKAGDQLLNASSASSLNVVKEYEKHAVGADLVIAPIMDNHNKALVFASLSSDGLNCYKAFKFTDFALPKMMQPHTSKFLLQNYGVKGFALNVGFHLIDLLLKLLVLISKARVRRFSKNYKVLVLDIVPEWVDDMVLYDGHKYMELHDHKWMQWCLDNSFSKDGDFCKRFYAIYNKDNRPIGFFIISERTSSIPDRNIYELKRGTVMEWGSIDEKQLSEFDIIRLALNSFSRNLSLVQIASMNKDVLKRLKWLGFIHHGYHHIVFKDTSKSMKDAKDPSLWRLRFGYGDSFF